jgi:hypothetical protein
MARFYVEADGMTGHAVSRRGSRKSGVHAVVQDNADNKLEVRMYSADPDTPRRSRDCNDENMVDIDIELAGVRKTLYRGTLKGLEEACETRRLPPNA